MKSLLLVNSARLWNLVGVLGIIALHSSTIPVLWALANGNNENIPPLSMMLLLFTGLTLMTIRYYYDIKDTLAVVSNLIGMYANMLMAFIASFTGIFS